ncbi:MAG: hypothetical protein ABI045_01300 [Flavobacteriales bacterium]
MLNYAITLLIGFLPSMMYMFAREVFDNKVKVIDDVIKYIKAPLIGTIGESSHDNNIGNIEQT